MEKFDNFPVSRNIERLIRKDRLDKRKIALAAGISEQEFEDMLQGKRVINPSEIRRICTALGVDANALFEGRR